MTMRLHGKIAVITGSASGIGRSTALLFAKEGATVVVNDLDEAKGQDTVVEIADAGGQALFIKADVTHPQEVAAMAEEVIGKFGQIDILMNNAGISGVGMLHEIEPDVWDRIMRIN